MIASGVRRVMASGRVVSSVVLAAALAAPGVTPAVSLLPASRRPEPLGSLALFPGGVLSAIAPPAPRDDAKPEARGGEPEDRREEEEEPQPPGDEAAPSLDFDLLGEAEPPPETVDAGRLRLRRRMLTWHQGIGLGLLGLQLATTVAGQLNYSDRYAGGPQTLRYRRTHQALAYSTLGVFAVNGALALLAPSPGTPRKLDRVMVHRIAMFTAAAGMLAQGVLGVYTRERVGHLDQERFATAHLVVGYATLAAVLTGVGALVL
jgi:hypothetical protein